MLDGGWAARVKVTLLPQEEWKRIQDASAPYFLPFVDPQQSSVIAVEDGEKVVASISVLTVTMLEGLWIDPQYRNPGVARALMRFATEEAQKRCPNSWALCALGSDEMREMVKRVGGLEVPNTLHVLPLGE